MVEPTQSYAEADGDGFFRSRTFIVLVIILAVLIVLWVASELIIPPIASSIAKGEITKRYPQATDVSVSIKAFPALKLAFKNYDSLTVKVGDITLQGVRFERIELKSSRWPLGTYTATLGQGEIARFFSLKNSYVIDPQLVVEQGAIQVAGDVDVGLLKVGVTSRGALEPVNGKLIFFRPGDIQVQGVRVPEGAVALVAQVMDDNPVFVVRADLPYTITSIVAEQGKLLIKGQVNLEKALNVKL